MNKNGELQNVAGEDIDRYLHPGPKQVSLSNICFRFRFSSILLVFFHNLSISRTIRNCCHVFFNFLSLDNIMTSHGGSFFFHDYLYSCSGQRQAVKFSTSGHELAEPTNGHISSTFLSEHKHRIEHWTASNAFPVSECGWN